MLYLRIVVAAFGLMVMPSNGATNYDDSKIADDFAKSRKINLNSEIDRSTIEWMLGDVKGKDIADFACGDGHYARHFNQLGAHRVIGVDISSDMIALAKQAEASNPLGIEYYNSDCSNLNLGNVGTFHIVTATYLLNYMKDQAMMDRTFKGVASVLKPGGRFVGITVNPQTGLPDHPEDWFQKYGVRCYGYPNGGREKALSGEKISCDINKMDGTADPIHLDVFFHTKNVYEDAAKAAGFQKLEWFPMNRPEVCADWPQEFFDWHNDIGYVATMPLADAADEL